jgi:hypothetical protein
VKVDEGKLVARVRFATADANPQAEQIWKLVQQKVIRAVSVGFRANKGKYIEETETYVLSGCELYEISFCAIGANPDAVTLSARTASLDAIRSLVEPTQPTESKTMEAVLKALGANTEAEALNVITNLQRVRSTVLAATGASTDGEVEGRLQAWKQAASQLDEANKTLAELTAKSEHAEREQLITAARRAGKIAPASLEWAKSASLESLKSFLATAPAIPQFAAKADEEPAVRGDLEWNGKKWHELKPSEKHALHTDSPEIYAAMRDAAKAA